MSEPFGSLAPTAAQERFRALGHRLPKNYFGRKAASALLGPAGGRARRAYDVTIFGTQRARLHPYDNICEKRVYLTPQLWDAPERALLADLISGFAGRTFHFVDAGANVGLYTLFARAEALRAGAAFNVLCIEADPDMQERLAFNLDASAASGEVRVSRCAVAGVEGKLRFSVNARSRGESRIDAAGGVEVAARRLQTIVAEAGFPEIDAMKMDVEGAEFPALEAFFAEAPKALWPRLLILETSHEAPGKSASACCSAAGYGLKLKTRMNAVLVLNG
ncbi:MAG: FkbM family methyltransferase [Parvularculaceae bacterium]